MSKERWLYQREKSLAPS